MSPLRIEVFTPDLNEWTAIGVIDDTMRPGSISDHHDGVRDTYFFGVDVLKRQGYIKKAAPGVDIEFSGVRALSALGSTVLATLEDGQSYEMTARTDKSPEARKLRFTFTT